MSFVVLATDRISDEGLAPLREGNHFEIHSIDDSSSEAFSSVLADAHALIVRSATKVGPTMISAAPELRVIGRAGVGVDNIDLAAASARGIAVFNAPGANTIAAAELTMGLLLALVRRVTEADQSIRSGRWDRAVFQGVELRGRTIGLIGAGRIGGEVARMCAAFGMDVIVYDPYLPEGRAADLGVRAVSFEELISGSDVVSLHVPLSRETTHFIDSDVMRRMKPGVLLVNTSRGGVIVEEDLAVALREGVVGGAALDVYEIEPLPVDSPLRTAPNLVMTPHLGASTGEAQIGVAREVALAVRHALTEGDVSAALNASELG